MVQGVSKDYFAGVFKSDQSNCENIIEKIDRTSPMIKSFYN